MKIVLQIISWAAIAGTIIPSILYLSNSMELDQVKMIMLISAVLWFAATPFWMERGKA